MENKYFLNVFMNFLLTNESFFNEIKTFLKNYDKSSDEKKETAELIIKVINKFVEKRITLVAKIYITEIIALINQNCDSPIKELSNGSEYYDIDQMLRYLSRITSLNPLSDAERLTLSICKEFISYVIEFSYFKDDKFNSSIYENIDLLLTKPYDNNNQLIRIIMENFLTIITENNHFFEYHQCIRYLRYLKHIQSEDLMEEVGKALAIYVETCLKNLEREFIGKFLIYFIFNIPFNCWENVLKTKISIPKYFFPANY